MEPHVSVPVKARKVAETSDPLVAGLRTIARNQDSTLARLEKQLATASGDLRKFLEDMIAVHRRYLAVADTLAEACQSTSRSHPRSV